MKHLIHFRSLLAAAMVLGSVALSAQADETAVLFDDSSIYVGTGGENVYGWQFTTVSDIQISSLGVYDYFRGDGLAEQHAIGIWDVTDPAHMLVSAVVPAGTTAPIVNNFRYVEVNPVTLPFGHDFVIAALYNLDPGVGSANAPNWLLTTGPGLQFGGYRYGEYPTTSLTFPQFNIPTEQEFFGPNFTYAVVPEPSLWSLAALGGVVFVFSRKRKRCVRLG